MTMHTRGSWIPKLRPQQEPKVESDRRGRMLIPTPMLVARELRRVPRGRLITPTILRARLARRAGADFTCPLTTGIFLSIVAGATEESLAAGRRAVAPYWRVVLDNGTLPPKFPPGTARQASHLREEGHRLVGGTRVANVDAAFMRR